MTATVKAPAKVNFTLDITGKLSNGYHTVDMVMQAVSLYDVVTVNSVFDGIELTVSDDNIPSDESNTAYKAAKEFFEYTGIKGGAKIHIDKHIPSQAGLAGGSTDAAAVLVALNHIYKSHVSMTTLRTIAAKIGADVPFCIKGGIVLARGIGTDLAPLWCDALPFYMVICKPNCSVSTEKAYALSDQRPYSTQKPHSVEFIDALEKAEYDRMWQSVYNDFESLVNLPQVDKLKKEMNKLGSICSCMTGSGSAVYGVFNTMEQAEECCDELKKSYDEVFTAQPVDSGCVIQQM